MIIDYSFLLSVLTNNLFILKLSTSGIEIWSVGNIWLAYWTIYFLFFPNRRYFLYYRKLHSYRERINSTVFLAKSIVFNNKRFLHFLLFPFHIFFIWFVCFYHVVRCIFIGQVLEQMLHRFTWMQENKKYGILTLQYNVKMEGKWLCGEWKMIKNRTYVTSYPVIFNLRARFIWWKHNH